MQSLLLAGLLCSIVATSTTAEPRSILLVRHAERADADGAAQSDPGLSETGRERAQTLATTLKDVKVDAIFATELRRTQETAAPLAKQAGLRLTIIPAKETALLVTKIQSSEGNVLVIGHSNTLPQILRGLGITAPIALAESDYDNLFLVWHDPTPRLLRLHYR